MNMTRGVSALVPAVLDLYRVDARAGSPQVALLEGGSVTPGPIHKKLTAAVACIEDIQRGRREIQESYCDGSNVMWGRVGVASGRRGVWDLELGDRWGHRFSGLHLERLVGNELATRTRLRFDVQDGALRASILDRTDGTYVMSQVFESPLSPSGADQARSRLSVIAPFHALVAMGVMSEEAAGLLDSRETGEVRRKLTKDQGFCDQRAGALTAFLSTAVATVSRAFPLGTPTSLTIKRVYYLFPSEGRVAPYDRVVDGVGGCPWGEVIPDLGLIRAIMLEADSFAVQVYTADSTPKVLFRQTIDPNAQGHTPSILDLADRAGAAIAAI